MKQNNVDAAIEALEDCKNLNEYINSNNTEYYGDFHVTFLNSFKTIHTALNSMKEQEVVLDYPEKVELVVVAKRCVYVNDHRICGGKPYVSERLPQHSFTVDVRELLFDALGL